MNAKSWKEVLLEVIEEVDAAEQQAVDAAVEADLSVDRSSDHWLPAPLTPELIGRIRAWLAPPRAAPAPGSGHRFAGPGSSERQDTANRSPASALDTLTAPPAPGLDAARFHWLPILLRPAEDGECTELVLQAKDPESAIPIPIVMVVLDGEVLPPVDEDWDYDAERGRLELLLEGVIPTRYRLDLSRSDEGKVVLQLTSEFGATNESAAAGTPPR